MKEHEELKRIRDELKVQVHLGKADLKKTWNTLEEKWWELQGKLSEVSARIANPSDKAAQKVSHAIEDLARELKEGYARVREALSASESSKHPTDV